MCGHVYKNCDKHEYKANVLITLQILESKNLNTHISKHLL
jgi:hypothetical protein